ncbi:ring-cleaving dioxygenase [Alkalihalobacillus sp. 1P02AB]|uniref:ring-cleaving dioxygenase n=1 Tax=Alkalihalobacillus sp. 1P02AB TaxID=3132260 RepID=UPI0039A4A262
MERKSLIGTHHVSSLTANAKENYHFYTEVLGMRLVKKTVNQDDTSVYHLFYADERGNPGTDLTFFEIPHAGRTYYGNNAITLTTLRVPNDQALNFWQERFEKFKVEFEPITEVNKRKTIKFWDFEGQRLMLVSDEHNHGVAGGKAWGKSPVPVEYAIYGLGPVALTVPKKETTAAVLKEVLGFKLVGEIAPFVEGQANIQVFETGEGGTGAEIYLEERTDLPRERPGRGSVHHVAFRVENQEELDKWAKFISGVRLPNSGTVERYYFRSLYFREPNGILFELATDGPGFEGDESFETLGENLALPPFFEDKRKEIEAKLVPLNTKQ